MTTHDTLKVTYFNHRDMRGRDIDNRTPFDANKLTTEAKEAYRMSAVCLYQWVDGHCDVVKSRY